MISPKEFTPKYIERTREARIFRRRSEIETIIDHTIRNYCGEYGRPIHIRILSDNVDEATILDVLEKYKGYGWFFSGIIPPGSYDHYEVWISTTEIKESTDKLWQEYK